MAKTSLRSRLQRLFSTNVIVRHAGGKKLKIADTDNVQAIIKRGLTDRYTKLYSNMAGGTGKAEQLFHAAQRLALFRDYEEMDNDAIIASASNIFKSIDSEN